MTGSDRFVFHITDPGAWRRALVEGVYRTESLDTEGFIHCSTRAQVVDTANRFYAGAAELVLLRVDSTLLDADLVYERPLRAESAEEKDTRFPHLYGSLPLDAVVEASMWKPDAGGRFAFPENAETVWSRS